MKLLVDCGGTKCDWKLINPETKSQVIRTTGYNATTHNFEDLKAIIKSLPQTWLKINELHFYAAGINDGTRDGVLQFLSAAWSNAKVKVESDSAACKTICDERDAGLCIMIGTGTHLAYKRDGHWTDLRGMGYILGDEGSGLDISKQLLTRYYRGQLSSEVHNAIQKFWPIEYGNFVAQLYGPQGVDLLRHFSIHLKELTSFHEVRNIWQGRIACLLSILPADLPPTEAILFGTIANMFKEFIQESLIDLNVRRVNPVASVIDALDGR